MRWALWAIAVVLTVTMFGWQDRTGPTSPLDGAIRTPKGPVHFTFARSANVGTPLPLVLRDPLPPNIRGEVAYRRHSSTDAWTVVPMRRGDFHFSRRGRSSTLRGLGATLPGLRERAGKYEMLIRVDDGGGTFRSVTGKRPVYARFKGAVPTWALVAHILAIFASMAIAIRTVLETATNGHYKRLLYATIVSLLLGGFVLGPLIQWYAFGVWWAGVPFGYDWTDNKVLVELAAWLGAAYAHRNGRRSRRAIYAAGVVTALVYFIPHSIFGSEYDYTTGTGHGTAG